MISFSFKQSLIPAFRIIRLAKAMGGVSSMPQEACNHVDVNNLLLRVEIRKGKDVYGCC